MRSIAWCGVFLGTLFAVRPELLVLQGRLFKELDEVAEERAQAERERLEAEAEVERVRQEEAAVRPYQRHLVPLGADREQRKISLQLVPSRRPRSSSQAW